MGRILFGLVVVTALGCAPGDGVSDAAPLVDSTPDADPIAYWNADYTVAWECLGTSCGTRP